MKSMTGFGEAKGKIANKLKFRIEIRSVNNRFFNLKMALPEALNKHEGEIEKLIREYIHRGSINFSLRLDAEPDKHLSINRQLIRNYYQELKRIQTLLGLKREISFESLINLPCILEMPDAKSGYLGNKEWNYIYNVIRTALVNLSSMREREGNRLKKALQKNLQKIFVILNKIEKQIPYVRDNYETSFRKKLKSILDNNLPMITKPSEKISDKISLFDLERNLAFEIATFSQRADINEEIQRLKSHLKEVSATLDENQEIGKKLDFIAQEMLREINTIGSKSNDTQITYSVILLKSEIEKIKEQVQNIE